MSALRILQKIGASDIKLAMTCPSHMKEVFWETFQKGDLSSRILAKSW